MRIGFLDTVDYDYTVETVYRQPLGGSSSAVCYLAEELAKQGQDVFLLNKTTTPGAFLGVMCLPFASLSAELRQSLDVLVIVNMADQGSQIRAVLPERTRLILWSGHAHDQPAMQGLRRTSECSLYDGFALVSEWQSRQFQQQFALDPQRICILRNGISPVFHSDVSRSPASVSRSRAAPILAYTSTPFRGLDVLLKAFPAIRCAIPGATLKVFSSMKVYNLPETDYAGLYERCRETEGVEYVGSIAQPELADELKAVSILAYPNTFAETSCIAVMEAMASGCWIVTSALGALPETTAGFAHLVPMNGNLAEYQQQFIAAVVDVAERHLTHPRESELHLQQQVSYVNQAYRWSERAKEWIAWLEALVDLARKRSPNHAAIEQLQQRATTAFQQQDYVRATAIYYQLVEQAPECLSNYWHLGLSLLLQEELDEAQAVWMTALLDDEAFGDRVSGLSHLLQSEAERQQQLANWTAVEQIERCLQSLAENF